jgi:hypothetical protein
MRLIIQLRKYARKYNLPFILCKGQEGLYKLLRRGITGGLSNVHNRENIRGKTEIKKLFYNEKIDDIDVIPSNEAPKIRSHVIGVDFNSLYPSSYSSIKHPSNPYTDNITYMPGPLKFHTTDKKKIMEIINGKKELFVCSVKGHIPKSKWNTPTPGAISETATVVNFPPIIRNIEIMTNEETIGTIIYNYMNENNYPVDQKTRKLTQMLNTNDEFITIDCCYLWGLIDSCYFVVDDVEELFVFEKNRAFNAFSEGFMKRRLESTNEVDKFFYKICLNGAYGYDAMNEEKFTKCEILNTDDTYKR